MPERWRYGTVWNSVFRHGESNASKELIDSLPLFKFDPEVRVEVAFFSWDVQDFSFTRWKQDEISDVLFRRLKQGGVPIAKPPRGFSFVHLCPHMDQMMPANGPSDPAATLSGDLQDLAAEHVRRSRDSSCAVCLCDFDSRAAQWEASIVGRLSVSYNQSFSMGVCG